MTERSSTFLNGRGQRLHCVHYLPPGTPKALLIFHHGYGEHTGRYDYGTLAYLSYCWMFMERKGVRILLSNSGKVDTISA